MSEENASYKMLTPDVPTDREPSAQKRHSRSTADAIASTSRRRAAAFRSCACTRRVPTADSFAA